MAKKSNKRSWNFKRSRSEDRSFLDFFGSKRQPKTGEGLTHVEDLLGQIVDEVGLREGVTLDELQVAWSSIVGPNIANNSEPLDIRDGVLRVRVSQPVIKFELQQQRHLILDKVKAHLAEAKINAVEIVI